MAAAARRRLGAVGAAIVAPAAANTNAAAALLAQAERLAATNELKPGDFPADVIRQLMVADGTNVSNNVALRRADGRLTETERRLALEMPSDIELGVEPWPLMDGNGRVTAAQMETLRGLEAAAAAVGRYEDAVYLQRLQGVIDPAKPPLSYEDCAPEAAEDAAEFFLTNGFVIVRGAMAPDRIARVQASWYFTHNSWI